jgi:cobalamin biosynthesis Mg chelatase CobN
MNINALPENANIAVSQVLPTGKTTLNVVPLSVPADEATILPPCSSTIF